LTVSTLLHATTQTGNAKEKENPHDNEQHTVVPMVLTVQAFKSL